MDDKFPFDRIEEIALHPADFRLIERVPFTIPSMRESLPVKLVEYSLEETIFPIVFLDTETTGLYSAKDKIIQLSMVSCLYSADQNRIVEITNVFDGFEDPGFPIPPEIVELTGITDSMVEGQVFDDIAIRNFIGEDSLVVAHNARFDRPFFDKRFGDKLNINKMPWACSLEEVPWKKLGFHGSKLEYIAQTMGYFYDAHLAINDSLTLCFIMHKLPLALESLLQSATKNSFRVEAQNTNFKIKDHLKNLHFKWDGTKRLWYFTSNDPEFVMNTCQKAQAIIDQSGQGDLAIYQFSACERYRMNASISSSVSAN